MKKCNTCGESNRKNAEFCFKCGKQLSNFTPSCPNCKSIIAPDDTFCNKCGEKLIETGLKKETYKYIEKPAASTGKNRNFKIFMGLIGGFATITVIVLILVFAIDIINLTGRVQSIAETEKVEETETDDFIETETEDFIETETEDLIKTIIATEEEEDGQIAKLPIEELTDDQMQVLSMLGYPDEYVIIFDEGNSNKRIEVWIFEAMQSSFLFEGGKYTSSEMVITPTLLPDNYNIRPEEFVYSMTPEEVGYLVGDDGHQIIETNTGLKTIIYGEGNIVCTYNTDDLLVYVSRSKKVEIAEG